MSGPTTDTRLPRAGRLFAGVATLTGTLVIAAIAVAAVIGGSRLIAQNADRAAEARTAAPQVVEVVPVHLSDSYTLTRQFVGRTEPARRADLGFEEGGTVVAVLVDEGDPVRDGQVLARLDNRALLAERARLAAAEAALAAQIELAGLTSDRQKDLAARDFSSDQRADEARLRLRELEARQDELAAQQQALEVRIDKATLRAPFAGHVGARHVDEGVRVGPATPVLDLLETGSARVRIGLPTDLAAELPADTRIAVYLDGQPASLTLLSRRREIDPVTRTRDTLFAVEGALPDAAAYGDLVAVSVPRRIVAEGVWLPVTALLEGESGLWTVFVVAADDDGVPRARRESVEVILADAARAYVRGALPVGGQIVSGGTHRLSAGQAVSPVPAPPAPEAEG
jgi:RND family efflux transporter MFP subunit